MERIQEEIIKAYLKSIRKELVSYVEEKEN